MSATRHIGSPRPGDLIGYVLPFERTKDVCCGLFVFDSLVACEQDRFHLKTDPEAQVNLAYAAVKG